MVISDRSRKTVKAGGEGEERRKRKSECEVKNFPQTSDRPLLPSGVRIPWPVIYGVWIYGVWILKSLPGSELGQRI